MKILVYGINYYPECIGIGKYSTEMCEWLANNGNDVTVIAAMPYYPNWKVSDDYSGKSWHTEIINKVVIYRCPIFVPKKISGLTRVIHELSFILSSIPFWLKLFFAKFDVIISVAPPLQIGLPAVFYKLFHKVISVYHVQDLQLEAAKELGLIKNRLVLNLAERLERIILNSSNIVTTISDGMLSKLHAKNVPKENTYILRNWTDTNFIRPEVVDINYRELFQIDRSKRIVLYSGNIGEKQGIDILIDVAESLSSHDIVFLVIGGGAYKPKFEERIQLRQLKNIKVFPLQPLEIFNKILNLVDIHLVIQKKAAADLVMPSKFSTILAAGAFAIVTADENTTLYNLVKQNEMAIVIEPENPVLLRDTILSSLSMDLTKYKSNARAYALNNLEREMIMKSFNKFISQRRETND